MACHLASFSSCTETNTIASKCGWKMKKVITDKATDTLKKQKQPRQTDVACMCHYYPSSSCLQKPRYPTPPNRTQKQRPFWNSFFLGGGGGGVTYIHITMQIACIQYMQYNTISTCRETIKPYKYMQYSERKCVHTHTWMYTGGSKEDERNLVNNSIKKKLALYYLVCPK